jgi:lipoprotein-anchoring transpeptidase ErfK/SrfK
MRRLFLLAALGALTACSDPSTPSRQAEQGQKGTETAKVAPPIAQPSPTVPANAPSALALDDGQGGPPAVAASGDAAVAEAAAEPPSSAPAQALEATAPVSPAAPSADASPLLAAINDASVAAKSAPPSGWTIKGVDPALVRLEVLLDRAGFSPGVIDGKDGQNLKQALAAYASAKGLDDDAARMSLAMDSAPAAQSYTITMEDEKGPFIGDPPKDYELMAKLPVLSYSSPLQALAEKFHMDQRLLKALNPEADFGKAGSAILVAAPRTGPRSFTAARIEVDKSKDEVRVYDASGAVVAYYPATVGSTERPAPSGAFKVVAVAHRPAYFYDPKRLTFAPEGARGKLRIAPGPNNPVGDTWIALNIPTYGIHGTPEPASIGKRQSHGCVRLTNWDAVELGKAVKKGVPVVFVGTERKA